jgi:hypothetical protein
VGDVPLPGLQEALRGKHKVVLDQVGGSTILYSVVVQWCTPMV